MKRISSSVNMIPFTKARIVAESNQYALSSGKAIKNSLDLCDYEKIVFNKLSNCTKKTSDEQILYCKLLIKKSVYSCINEGKFMSSEIDFVQPLDGKVKKWLFDFGYALSPKQNTIWITMPDGWQYESSDSPPPSETIFTILW